MPLNETVIQNIQNFGQFIELSNKTTTIPALFILFISTFLFLLLIGVILIRKNPKSFGKFFAIYFLTMVLSGGILVALILMPNLVQQIVDFLS